MIKKVVDLNPDSHIPPLVFKDDADWKPFQKKTEFLELVNPINSEFETSRKTTVVKKRPISFFKNAFLLKVTDTKKWEEEWAEFYFIYANDDYYQLNSINIGLSEIVDTIGLNLTTFTLIDYIRMVGYFYMHETGKSMFFLDGQACEWLEFMPGLSKLDQKRARERIYKPVVRGPNSKGLLEFKIQFLDNDVMETSGTVHPKTGLIAFGDDMELIK